MGAWRESNDLRQQQLEVFAPEIADDARIGCEGRVGELALLLLQFEDALFDRVAGDQTVREDMALLTDAVRAIDRLRLDRRVPPRVEQEHVCGGGEIQPEPAGLQA